MRRVVYKAAPAVILCIVIAISLVEYALQPPALPRQHYLEEDYGALQRSGPRLTVSRVAWNTANGRQYERSLWSRQMYEAVLQHPRFNNDSITTKDCSSGPVYIFLDFETAGETNWPIYGGGQRNADPEHGHKRVPLCENLERILATAPSCARVLVFNSLGPGPKEPCIDGRQDDQRVVVVTVSAQRSNVRPSTDIALPAPAVNPVELSLEERIAISECRRKSDLTLVFLGAASSPVRQELLSLDNGRDVLMRTGGAAYTLTGGASFHSLLRRAVFAAVPQGESLPPDALAEVLSAGAIPVILADGWRLPLAEAIAWNATAVLLPERSARDGSLLAALRNISAEQRCRMQQNARRAFEEHLRGHRHLLDSLVGILDRRAGVATAQSAHSSPGA